MSAAYKGIDWNRQKRLHDGTLLLMVLLYAGAFAAAAFTLRPGYDWFLVTLRGTAVLGFVLLHVLLMIGPLARLHRGFLPFLYNRRHLGVFTFFILLVHGAMSIWRYHGGTDRNPVFSVFTMYAQEYNISSFEFRNLPHFPFEALGFMALAILGVLAATSHDFWQRNLSPRVWKALHMLVYPAYMLAVLHVMLGYMQDERHVLNAVLVGVGAACVIGPQLIAYSREARRDTRRPKATELGFVDVCHVKNLREGEGLTVNVGKERVAVFLHQGRVFATSDACRHQGGPLGEGRIRDGCITCPWHGWKYRPSTGASTMPGIEAIATHDVSVEGGIVYVSLTGNAPGHACPGVPVPKE